MKKRLIPFACWLLCAAAPAPMPGEPYWTDDQLGRLAVWLDEAPKEALNVQPANDLMAALQAGESERLQLAATAAALRLANAYLFGNTAAKERAGWNIGSDDDEIDLRAFLAASLAKNDIDGFFRALRPRHSDYETLRLAYATEADPARRAKLARNLERWRWMPLSLGNRYLLVNTAAYEVGLWENGRQVQSWPVIVGKPRTPTPVFSAKVTGVTYNPWWDVPQSIVAESVGALTRNHPAQARSRGYVWGDGHYRQRPGPTNALGLMKLVMPNPYNVYLHDTPNKALFEKPTRAFSHGCIRVGGALAFASTLLAGTTNQTQIDTVLASGKTTSLSLNRPVPVYITYFTADVVEAGTVQFHADHYGRDDMIGYVK
jgi:murein L,D-transpeptidase YcbB/YkuD